jgi:hypothetical protein
VKFWHFLKSSPLAITALVVSPTLLSFIVFFFFSPPESPAGAFQRVVANPIPASVRNISASGSGGTQLAGGWDLVSFELAAEDFPKILARHKFVERRPEDLVRPGRMLKKFSPLEDPTYFQAPLPNSMTTLTIKTNSSRTVVQYFRDRM